MSDSPGAQPESSSSAQRTNSVSNAERTALLQRAVKTLYGERKVTFKDKGPKLSGLKAISEWRNSDEVKNMGEGATLVQGLEADKNKQKEKDRERDESPKKNDGPEPAPVPEDKPPKEVIIPPALNTDQSLGIVVDPTRVEQTIGGLAQHDRAREKPARGFWRGLVTPITNPGEFARNFWQNTLFKGSFDARSMSFSRTMMEIARSQLSGLDSSIPFEMPQDILDRAIEEGRKVKASESGGKKFSNGAKDIFSGLFAVTQNTDMKYAEDWFKANGKDLVTGAKTTSIEEQTQLGERFAIRGDNKDVISTQVGENRFKLDQVIPDKAVRDGLQTKIKELTSLYAEKKINDEELLKRFNEYYHKEVFPKIDPTKQKELEGVEVSSNILRFARELQVEDVVDINDAGEKITKTRYQRFHDEKTEDGQKSKWEELHFDIFVGKGKYEVARGEIKLSNLQKELIHRMVEADYKVSNGMVEGALKEGAKDFIIYGGAYLAGGTGAVVMAGRSFFHVGGLMITPLVAAAREGVLVSGKGKLYGLRGKAVTDFEQVSRESATGRVSMDKAKLRPQFEKAMVDQRKASELSTPIFELINKSNLSETEQKQLLQALAHAKARLTLTDLSTKSGRALFDTVGEISVAQNFIGYSQDTRNAEMTALRAAIVQGASRLAVDNPALYGKLSQAQAVYEAQLKIGSFENKLAAIIAKDSGMTQADATNAVAEFYENLGIDNKSRKSLYAAARTLAGVVDKRAATTAAFAFAVSPIMGTEMHVLFEAGIGVKELATGHLGEWTASWAEVLKGDVPLTYDANNNLVSGLSALQKDSLWVHNMLTPPLWAPHNEVIDGVTVQLPGGVQYGHYVDSAGVVHQDADALINAKTGEVLMQMDKSQLFYDGTGHLMVKLDNGQTEDAVTAFGNLGQSGVHLVQDPGLNKTNSTTEAGFSPAPSHDQMVDVGGKSVAINTPDNAHWQYDNTSHKWDLIGTKADGTTVKLIDDAVIKPNGQIDTTGANVDSHINITPGEPVPASGNTETQASLWGDLSKHSYRVVWGHSQEVHSDRDFVTQTTGPGHEQHPYGVDIRFVDDHIRDPNTGQVTTLNDHYQDGSMGVLLEVKGLHGVNDGQILVKNCYDKSELNGQSYFSLNLDPTNTTRMVTIVNGTSEVQVPMAALAQSVLNEKVLTEHPVGPLDSEMSVATMNVFNLANAGHTGHVLMGFITSDNLHGLHGHENIGPSASNPNQLFMPVHEVSGTNPVSQGTVELPGPPGEVNYHTTVNIGEIGGVTSGSTQLGYRIDYDHNNDLPPFLIPVPIRENVEKSVRGPSGGTPTNQTNSQTNPRVQEDAEKAHKIIEKIAGVDTEALKKELKENEEALSALGGVIKGNLSSNAQAKVDDEKVYATIEARILELKKTLGIEEKEEEDEENKEEKDVAV